MEFDKSKVYTALNADESLIGAKGYFAESLCGLIRLVKSDFYKPEGLHTIESIDEDSILANDCGTHFNFFYLIEPAHEKFKVIMSGALGLEIVPKNYLTTAYSECEGTKEECEQYISEHSKPKCRPFKDCDELIKTYHRKLMEKYKTSVDFTDIELPSIWVEDKVLNRKRLITFIDDDGVGNNMDFFKYDYLFEYYTFLDGSVCGVEE